MDETMKTTLEALGLDSLKCYPHYLRDERRYVKRDEKMRAVGIKVNFAWTCLILPSFARPSRVTVVHGAWTTDDEPTDPLLRAVFVQQEDLVLTGDLVEDPLRPQLGDLSIDYPGPGSITIDGSRVELTIATPKLETQLRFANPRNDALSDLLDAVHQVAVKLASEAGQELCIYDPRR